MQENMGHKLTPYPPLCSVLPKLPAHLLHDKPKRTLLLVDDEGDLLSALRRQLRQIGCGILTASDGQQGLDLMVKHKVGVITSEQRVPGMTGVEFLRRVKALYQDTVRFVLSELT